MQYILFTIIFLLTASFAIASKSAAPWVISRKKIQQRLAIFVQEKKLQTVCDLGCGSGDILFCIAKTNPATKLFGYEISILPYVIGKVRQLFYKNVQIKFKNLFKQKIDKMDLVIVFLMQTAYPKLLKRLKQEIGDNTLVAILAWPVPNMKTFEVLEQKDQVPIYIYQGKDIKQWQE